MTVRSPHAARPRLRARTSIVAAGVLTAGAATMPVALATGDDGAGTTSADEKSTEPTWFPSAFDDYARPGDADTDITVHYGLGKTDPQIHLQVRVDTSGSTTTASRSSAASTSAAPTSTSSAPTSTSAGPTSTSATTSESPSGSTSATTSTPATSTPATSTPATTSTPTTAAPTTTSTSSSVSTSTTPALVADGALSAATRTADLSGATFSLLDLDSSDAAAQTCTTTATGVCQILYSWAIDEGVDLPWPDEPTVTIGHRLQITQLSAPTGYALPALADRSMTVVPRNDGSSAGGVLFTDPTDTTPTATATATATTPSDGGAATSTTTPRTTTRTSSTSVVDSHPEHTSDPSTASTRTTTSTPRTTPSTGGSLAPAASTSAAPTPTMSTPTTSPASTSPASRSAVAAAGSDPGGTQIRPAADSEPAGLLTAPWLVTLFGGTVVGFFLVALALRRRSREQA